MDENWGSCTPSLGNLHVETGVSWIWTKDNLTYIDWSPYGPNAYADAAFFSTGLRDEAMLCSCCGMGATVSQCGLAKVYFSNVRFYSIPHSFTNRCGWKYFFGHTCTNMHRHSYIHESAFVIWRRRLCALQDGLLIGVYAIQLPPEYERSIEEMSGCRNMNGADAVAVITIPEVHKEKEDWNKTEMDWNGMKSWNQLM